MRISDPFSVVTADFVADSRYLKYIPINAARMQVQTLFYSSIPVSPRPLHGFLKLMEY